MTTATKAAQQILKEKAAKILKVQASSIQKVNEQPPEGTHGVGASVKMKSGAIPWRNISLDLWKEKEADA